MKRILLITCMSMFLASSAYAVQGDADSNGALDVGKGGTNSTTAAGAATNLGVGTGDDVVHSTLNITGKSLSFNNSQVVAKWVTGVAYLADVNAVIYGGKVYICKEGHLSASETEPGVGASWENAWTELTVGGVSTLGALTDVTGEGTTDYMLYDDGDGTFSFRAAPSGTGGEANVQSDYTQTDTGADDYIKNKPALGSAALVNTEGTLANDGNVPTGAAITTALADKANDNEVVKVADAVTAGTYFNTLITAATQADFLGLTGQDDIQTALGISLGAVNFGTFTGSTITDSQTLKAILQELETAVEGKQTANAALNVDAIEFVIDGGGSAITTGVKGYLEIPYAATINRVTTTCGVSGSIVVDIWKDTYANYPPTVADTITASAKPTLSSAIKAQDATLTGWTTSVAAGDWIGFNVDSATTVQRCTVSLKVAK